MKKILLIEPFYSGSHKSWADQFKNNSNHHIEILSLPGKFWKWRMYGGAYTLAQMYLDLDFDPDIILATDMLDLATFVALAKEKVKDKKIFLYFHENQMAYPWKEDGEDKRNNRDLHYGFMNYNSALVADKILFNSKHNMTSFYEAMRKILKAMPDKRHKTIEELYKKSQVLPIGIHLKHHDIEVDLPYRGQEPLILWNHRWEFDKNPADFFDALITLRKEGYAFKLALLGEVYKNAPKSLSHGLEYFKEDVLVTGFMTKETYSSWLQAADILPVTSIHDFFGISVMEAIYMDTYPILPNRLTYPDLYKIKENPEIFYETQDEFIDKLRNALDEKDHKSYRDLCKPYDWDSIIETYDQAFID
ncbi:DUF3524 domain-containing protein [Acidaminobacter sp. JC074]|uniref:tRNA-queuosine alpha-mannosyltransferase domain-containing protein n=1 Tax=Acidaminobacter sp. JC074 TaxID=2530199 RepID=UPI001F0E0FAF|nr:DUF3524 domain-containing protein [Acidaminobacter sp. JC074]MCH4886773.1 DUF3524 domain-containing protein [Acidaminobacter sp. JC074]